MPIVPATAWTAASIFGNVLISEDDGAIEIANSTTLVRGKSGTVQINGSIGDGPFAGTTGDYDLYVVGLAAGQTLTADVDSQSFGVGLDSVIQIYDANGALVTTADNFGSTDELLRFTATTAGTYYVAIRGFGGGALSNPFDSGSGGGVGSEGDYRLFLTTNTGAPGGPENLQDSDITPTNSLVAGSGDDILVGRAGNDTILGGDGQDLAIWFNGDGNDTFFGGFGSDVQEINGNPLADDVFALNANGVDAVFVRSNTDVFALALVDVEGVDVRGLGGNDRLTVAALSGTTLNGRINFFGGFGNDTLDGHLASNQFVARGDEGNDTLSGGNGADRLIGGANNDTLTGNAGIDTLDGGSGDDTFVLGADNDVVIDSGGLDTILSSKTRDLNDYVGIENLTLSGNSAASATGTKGNNALTGNSAANSLVGDAGNDQLNGGGGADAMSGGAGNDTYRVDNAGDSVVEADNGGTDQVISSVGYSLGQFVENLTLTGATKINMNGNALGNKLIGNSGNNIIDGMAGADVMSGGAGNDTYRVGNAGDSVVEANNAGTDQVFSSVGYSLSPFVENLTLTGAANVNMNGNTLGNRLVGNSGNNIIDGKAGADVISGGGGSDTFGFTTSLVSGNVDTITDFNVTADQIRLTHTIFNAIAGTGTLSAAQFAANASGTAQDANDRIIYETDTGRLFYDSNGSAAGGAVQFAKLSSGLALTANDFSII